MGPVQSRGKVAAVQGGGEKMREAKGARGEKTRGGPVVF